MQSIRATVLLLPALDYFPAEMVACCNCRSGAVREHSGDILRSA